MVVATLDASLVLGFRESSLYHGALFFGLLSGMWVG
jgi:hypothetical protein